MAEETATPAATLKTEEKTAPKKPAPKKAAGKPPKGPSKQEMIESISRSLEKMDARTIIDINRYVEAKKERPWMTSYYTASDDRGKALLSKIIALDSVRVSMLGSVFSDRGFDPQMVIDMRSALDQLESEMEEMLSTAYENGFGTRRAIEMYKKQKAKQAKLKNEKSEEAEEEEQAAK